MNYKCECCGLYCKNRIEYDDEDLDKNSDDEDKDSDEEINDYLLELKSNNEFNIMNSSISLGEIYLELKMCNKAQKYMGILDSLAIKLNDVYALRNAFRLKFNFYKQTLDYKNALESKLKYDSLNEKIIDIENHRGLEQKEIITQFEKNEQKAKEAQKQKDKENQDEKRKQQIIDF